jgi:hypothetical protein
MEFFLSKSGKFGTFFQGKYYVQVKILFFELKFNQNKEITVHNVKIMPQNLDRPHYSEK